MLTRLEVDGFKNLLDFSVDFGPFNCIAGPNGVGKSNLFDAIRFLSLLTEHPIMRAAQMVRGNNDDTSDLRDLFWSNASRKTPQKTSFRIAAEMIIEKDVSDDFGRPAPASSTFLRYEIEIGYEEAGSRSTMSQLVLLKETLGYITEGEAAQSLKFPHNALAFREQTVMNKRRARNGYISVQEAPDGQTEIMVHQDGGSRGPGQVASASRAPSTIVGTSNTSATPTILAARREMQKWRFLALEPSAMRKPDIFQTAPFVNANGGHLPAALRRLTWEAEQSQKDPEDVYASIANRLAALVPISSLTVDVDEKRQLLTLQVKERTGVTLPAASLSDGTLRFLALSVLAEDAQADGVFCIEEPENGIHPAKMPEMVKLLEDLAVDSQKTPSADNPFRQVIVATHSPVFVQLISPEDLLCAVETKIKGPDGSLTRTLRCRPLDNTWRGKAGEPTVGLGTIIAYLTSPPGAQLTLPDLTSGPSVMHKAA
jgi:predicted ATPase